MKIRITIVWVLIFLDTIVAHAQTLNSDSGVVIVNGWVLDEQTKQAVEYATVSLWRVEDSTLLYNVATDEEGYFALSFIPSHYYIRVEHVSYLAKLLPLIPRI